MAVTIIPINTPINGFENLMSKAEKVSLLIELIVFIPNIRIAKPKRIEAIFLCLERSEAKSIIMPINARIGENDSGFKSLKKTFSPFIPDKLKSHAVTVVPMLAPSIIPIV